MTLLINSNKDFDWVKTPCLLNFRSVKFHYVKETHMMLVPFWWTLVKFAVVSHHKRQPETNLFHDLPICWRSENTESDKWFCALHYTNELLVRVRLAFQKLLQTHQTSRNNKKLSNTDFVYGKALFGKLTN